MESGLERISIKRDVIGGLQEQVDRFPLADDFGDHPLEKRVDLARQSLSDFAILHRVKFKLREVFLDEINIASIAHDLVDCGDELPVFALRFPRLFVDLDFDEIERKCAEAKECHGEKYGDFDENRAFNHALAYSRFLE